MASTTTRKPVVLVVMDGVGVSFEKKGNAIAKAKIPNFKYISENYPGTMLRASGNEVGLSWGEMGNSEVGHLNIGSGLVVYQHLPRINLAIQDKTFFRIPAWKKAVEHAQKNKSDLHIMGLISNGGVHSHMNHLFAVLNAVKELKFKGRVFIHFFTDGRDAAPQSAVVFTSIVKDEIKKIGLGEIASVSGRYFAMDRNENWDRTKKTYDCLTAGIGEKTDDIEKAISDSYDKGINDEFIEPVVVVGKDNNPIGLVKDNDAAIFLNFRPDRARQLTQSFVLPEFNKFPRQNISNLLFITMIDYGVEYPIDIAFPSQYVTNPIAKVISDAGLKQLHIAETEKYAHVTYFLNGGSEKPLAGEDRIIIPSKNVKSFDLKPEMSAYEITDRLILELERGKYDFFAVNFANGDMVGHTGNFKAGVEAVEILDECIGKIQNSVLGLGGTLFITADHGNVEEMINLETGEIDKEHSTNPVPFWIISSDIKMTARIEQVSQLEPGGILADVAPTILEFMNLPKPAEMTGTSLLHVISSCSLTG